MHQIVETGLEDYLGGTASREFDSHLAACAKCRAEVAEFTQASVQISEMLGGFRSTEPPSPPLGFQARVVRTIKTSRQNRGLLAGFSLDPGFVSKLAFGSLLGLATLGGYLLTNSGDSMTKADHTPEAVMANHAAWSSEPEGHQSGMLVTLANYHE